MFQIGRRTPQALSRIQGSKRRYLAAAAHSCLSISATGTPEQSNAASSGKDPMKHCWSDVSSANSLLSLGGGGSSDAAPKLIPDMQLSGDNDEDDDGG